MKKLSLGLLWLYGHCVSPFLRPSCRYIPSCSEYAQKAILRHGVRRGVFLALRRLGRCHPWGGFGVDMVPKK